MAQASAHKLSYITESSVGVTPTNPRWQRLPDTRTTLNLTRDNLQSSRIQGNRFPAEPRQGASSVAGEIPTDLSAETYDDFLAAALRGDWTDITVGLDQVDISQDGAAAVTSDVGDTFATTNGTVTVERVSAKEEEAVLIYQATGSDTFTTFSYFGDQTLTIDGETFALSNYAHNVDSAVVKVGEVRKSFSILREFSDLGGTPAKPFIVYRGCEISQMTIQATSNSLATCSFTFLGQDATAPAENAPANSNYKPAVDSQVFDTFSGAMEIDGVEKCIVTDYNLTIDNGLQPRYTVGCQGSLSPEVGQSNVTGSLTLYFEDATIYEKYINDEKLALKLTLQDGLNNKRIINLPNLRLLPGTQPDVTEDGSITLAVSFSAHYDSTEDSHVSITRISEAA